jgi:hypothetical protein
VTTIIVVDLRDLKKDAADDVEAPADDVEAPADDVETPHVRENQLDDGCNLGASCSEKIVRQSAA